MDLTKHGFLKIRPKGKGKGIMVSDYLLPWSRLNLLSLPRTRQQDLGIPLEAAVLFEYGKEEGYWDGKMLLQQAVSKAFPIAEGLTRDTRFSFYSTMPQVTLFIQMMH
jgi:hypothetical protein